MFGVVPRPRRSDGVKKEGSVAVTANTPPLDFVIIPKEQGIILKLVT